MTLNCLGDLLSHSSQRKFVPFLVKSPEEKVDAIWREFFRDPSQWDDSRATKISDKYPDFKHKTTKVALWVDKKCNPTWVKSELMALNRNTAQHECCTEVTYKLINDLCNQGQLKMALDILYSDNGQTIKADCYTKLLQGCIKFKALVEGKRLHAHIVQNGLEQLEFISSTLVKMYASCGSLLNAQDTLDEMPLANSFSFNTLISAYCDCGLNEKALKLFYKMKRADIKPDKYTFANVLKACTNLKSLEEGEKVRLYIDKSGISSNPFLDAAIVNMYAKCGNLESAHSAFDAIQQPNIVCWTSLIAGYAQSGNIVDALRLFDQMQLTALEIFEQIKREGSMPNTHTWNLIIGGYIQKGNLQDAIELFAKMLHGGVQPDIVTYNAMITGYAECGCVDEALNVLKKMYQVGIEPDGNTWIAALSGFARVGKQEEALSLFQEMKRLGVKDSLSVAI
ncbi:hypothetical protein GOP47_0028957 [Adiantum capillus-veneris]|nr:hypothetical protein GOP47_0028957 [Adiantum capillus-veneris]